jgi:hypothetical protein
MRGIAGVVALWAVWGCHPTINFDVQATTTTQVQGTPMSFPLKDVNLSPATIDIASLAGFYSAQTAKDRVQSARLKKLTVSVPSSQQGQNQDLSFLSDLKIQIDVPNTTTPPPAQIAHLTAPPAPGTTSVDLALDDVDLAPYVKANTFRLITTVSGSTPRQTTTLQGDVTINVEASVL